MVTDVQCEVMALRDDLETARFNVKDCQCVSQLNCHKEQVIPKTCLREISYLFCNCRSFFFAFQCLLICQALLSCVFAGPVRGLVKVEAFRVLAMTATILLSDSDY